MSTYSEYLDENPYLGAGSLPSDAKSAPEFDINAANGLLSVILGTSTVTPDSDD